MYTGAGRWRSLDKISYGPIASCTSRSGCPAIYIRQLRNAHRTPTRTSSSSSWTNGEPHLSLVDLRTVPGGWIVSSHAQSGDEFPVEVV